MSVSYGVPRQSALALAFAASAAIAPAALLAQAPALSVTPTLPAVSGRAVVPYGVGEILTYKAHFGRIPESPLR